MSHLFTVTWLIRLLHDHLCRPIMTYTPIAESLDVELSLPILTIKCVPHNFAIVI